MSDAEYLRDKWHREQVKGGVWVWGTYAQKMKDMEAELDRLREELRETEASLQGALVVQHEIRNEQDDKIIEDIRRLNRAEAQRDTLLAALRQIDRACSHDLVRLTGRAHSDMRPEDRTRSIQSIARTAISEVEGEK